MTTPRKRKTQAWETEISAWLRRHEIPEEKINPFMHFLFKKKAGWDLELMREMVNRKKA